MVFIENAQLCWVFADRVTPCGRRSSAAIIACMAACLFVPHSCCTPPTAATATCMACNAAYLPHIGNVPCGLPLLLLPTFPTWLLCLSHIAVVHMWAPYHCHYCCGYHSCMAAYLTHIAGVPCGLPLLLAPILIYMAALPIPHNCCTHVGSLCCSSKN